MNLPLNKSTALIRVIIPLLYSKLRLAIIICEIKTIDQPIAGIIVFPEPLVIAITILKSPVSYTHLRAHET